MAKGDTDLSKFPREVIPALKRKLLAEAARAEAEAQTSRAEAAVAEIAQRDLERKEQEILAGDKYHYVYGFNDAVNQNSVAHCVSQLSQWARNKPGCGIKIVFNSPGGSPIESMALYDYLQTLKAKGHKLTTVAMGLAASTAGILLQAGNHRAIGAESYVLIHEISTGAIGKIGEIEDVVKFCKMIQKRVLNIFAERSNKKVGYFEKHWRRTDWWLSSDDCLKLGLVDEVLSDS
ncbi:MAG: ATP-dependent Clp protease proteolytic subunit [Gammaproteobacteria bacterium]|nr:ATP-dependent Clp protease proteolytic subunit [Gammaproteobacteria bacterium]